MTPPVTCALCQGWQTFYSPCTKEVISYSICGILCLNVMCLSVLYLQKSPHMYIKSFTSRIIPVQQKLVHHTVKDDLHDTQFIVFVRATTTVCKLLRGSAISWTAFKINYFYGDCWQTAMCDHTHKIHIYLAQKIHPQWSCWLQKPTLRRLNRIITIWTFSVQLVSRITFSSHINIINVHNVPNIKVWTKSILISEITSCISQNNKVRISTTKQNYT